MPESRRSEAPGIGGLTATPSGQHGSMDIFTGIVVASLLVVLLTFLVLGHIARKVPATDITDKRERRRLGGQAEIEEHDLPQMVAAANEYRGKRGKDLLTVEDVKRKVGREQLAILDEADKQQRAKATHGPSDRERRGF
jgi:hypothetical protein